MPVVASWRRGDVIPNDHPLYLGMTGFGSPATVRERIEAADALAGARVPADRADDLRVPRAGAGPALDARRPRAADRARRRRAGAGAGDPGRRPRVPASGRRPASRTRCCSPSRVAARDRHNAADRAAWEAATRRRRSAPWSGPGVHPGRVVADLRRLLPEDAIVTTDAGAFAGWAARGFRFRRPGTFLGPTSGAMGYALPGGARGGRSCTASGASSRWSATAGMGMTMAELETAVREGAHVVAIVFDNERYGMIRDHQDRQREPHGTRHGPRAAGLRGGGARLRGARRAGRDGRRVRAGAADGAGGVRTDADPGR